MRLLNTPRRQLNDISVKKSNSDHIGNAMVPEWECFSPTLGTSQSHAGTVVFPPWD